MNDFCITDTESFIGHSNDRSQIQYVYFWNKLRHKWRTRLLRLLELEQQDFYPLLVILCLLS